MYLFFVYNQERFPYITFAGSTFNQDKGDVPSIADLRQTGMSFNEVVEYLIEEVIENKEDDRPKDKDNK